MRRYIKRQLLELLVTMKDAAEMVTDAARKKNGQQFTGLLTDQQEAAVTIGKEIEASEGEGTEGVRLLELYCELLWKMSRKTTEAEVKAAVTQAKGLLARAGQEIQKLPEQLDVVFLPYKASMWDCMETVWRAAETDPDCNAYVIPIPYYDRKQDGSLGEKHYEGDLLPKDVPITSYLDYVLEQRHPEIIYIHNPFDEYNKVTSVAPEFYSRVIKDYTDTLVYIPYYITGEHIPETHRYLPAYLYADKVILQNDMMVGDLTPKVPERKILALGSPKAEKLLQLQSRREELVLQKIPEEWKKKIHNKKVILYNTSLTGILENSDYAMSKIRYVLSKFETREDVALLWRPHPLTDTTLQTMHPELWKEYLQIKRQFVKKNYGILDETPEAAVSVVLADAYIGEATSSIVSYFGVLGKPVFYLDWRLMEECSEEERAALWFTDCFFEDGTAWFVPRTQLAYNYLCKMDLNSGKVDLSYELPGEIKNPSKGNAYFGITRVGEKVVLSPVWSSDVYIYDMHNGQALKVPLNKSDIPANFALVFEYRGKAYLQPRNYPAVIELNVNTGICVYYETPISHEQNDEGLLFGIGSAVIEEKLYIPCADRNIILIFDLEQKSFTEKIISELEGGIYSLTKSGDEIWGIGNKTARLICWNVDTDQVRIWKEFPENFTGGAQPFRASVENGDEMLIFPENANMILAVDKNSGNIVERCIQKFYTEGERYFTSFSGMNHYWMARRQGDKIYALTAYNHGMLQYDCNTDKSILYPCRMSKENCVELKNMEIDKMYGACGTPNSLTESRWQSLDTFLDYVAAGHYRYYRKAQEGYRVVVKNLMEDCGAKIHEIIKKG